MSHLQQPVEVFTAKVRPRSTHENTSNFQSCSNSIQGAASTPLEPHQAPFSDGNCGTPNRFLAKSPVSAVSKLPARSLILRIREIDSMTLRSSLVTCLPTSRHPSLSKGNANTPKHDAFPNTETLELCVSVMTVSVELFSQARTIQRQTRERSGRLVFAQPADSPSPR